LEVGLEIGQRNDPLAFLFAGLPGVWKHPGLAPVGDGFWAHSETKSCGFGGISERERRYAGQSSEVREDFITDSLGPRDELLGAFVFPLLDKLGQGRRSHIQLQQENEKTLQRTLDGLLV